MYAHLHGTPPRPTQIDPGISPALERIILKALEKDPADRYHKVSDMLAAVENALAELPPDAPRSMAPLVEAASALPISEIGTRPTSAQSFVDVPKTPPPQRFVPPPPERSMTVPIAVILFVLLALAYAGWYFYLRVPPAIVTQTTPTSQEPATPVKHPEPQRNQQQQPQHEITPVPQPQTAIQPQTLAVEPQTENAQPVTTPVTAVDTPVGGSTTTTPPQQQEVTPPPPAAPGRIRYQGQYPVSIYQDRRLLLNTSQSDSMELPAGKYKITLVATDKVIIRSILSVVVKPGETTVIPEPAMAKFQLTATPSNCKIYIDTVFVDVAPLFDFPIQAGNHHVRVQWEGLEKEKGVFITVAAGQTIRLRAIADEQNPDIFEETH
jgi:serine/threonine protein kinase